MEQRTRPAKLAVIGGSGVYSIKGAKVVAEHSVTTPFGQPSDRIFELELEKPEATNRFLFLPRHGIGHRLLPSEINSRANLAALKQLGATHVLAVSAVGILADGIHPGDLVVPDQLFDRTKGVRSSTFFGGGIVGHVSFGTPFCPGFSEVVFEAARMQSKAHKGGTYVCIEGPQFSSRAESIHYRESLGASVIGMTAVPEAQLSREASLHYSLVALATDYDCWNPHESEVTADAVVAVVKSNSVKANAVVLEIASRLNDVAIKKACYCAAATAHAVMTDPTRITPEMRQRLAGVIDGIS
jgi:5'-methylthioadenosine phosphorylase